MVKHLFSAFLLLSLCSCGALWSVVPQDKNGKEPVSRELGSPVLTQGPQEGIEVTWIVPKESVDAFVLRYGFSKDSLNKEVRVSLSDLQKREDPDYGAVYHYVIAPIDKEAHVFVSIAAVRGDYISNFSDAVEEMGADLLR